MTSEIRISHGPSQDRSLPFNLWSFAESTHCHLELDKLDPLTVWLRLIGLIKDSFPADVDNAGLRTSILSNGPRFLMMKTPMLLCSLKIRVWCQHAARFILTPIRGNLFIGNCY